VEQGFGQCLHCSTVVNKATTRHQDELPSDLGNLNCVFVLFAIKFYYLLINLYANVLNIKELLNFTVML
jgi:hypothetical protein